MLCMSCSLLLVLDNCLFSNKETIFRKYNLSFLNADLFISINLPYLLLNNIIKLQQHISLGNIRNI